MWNKYVCKEKLNYETCHCAPEIKTNKRIATKSTETKRPKTGIYCTMYETEFRETLTLPAITVTN